MKKTENQMINIKNVTIHEPGSASLTWHPLKSLAAASIAATMTDPLENGEPDHKTEKLTKMEDLFNQIACDDFKSQCQPMLKESEPLDFDTMESLLSSITKKSNAALMSKSYDQLDDDSQDWISLILSDLPIREAVASLKVDPMHAAKMIYETLKKFITIYQRLESEQARILN